MYTIVPHKQNSVEWKKWRRANIGSSDAPIILEESPFKTPLQLWEEKMTGKETVQNFAMKRGSELENPALKLLNELLGTEYKPTCTQSSGKKWMIASLDGLDEKAKIPIVEIKCPSEMAHQKAIEGFVPFYYMPQLQHQMAVTGFDECLYVSFDGKDSLVQVLVPREKDWSQMIEKEEEFWDRMNNFDPPPATEKDYISINDPLRLEKIDEYKIIYAQRKTLEEKEEALKEEIINGLPHPYIRIGDHEVKREMRRGNVQYGKIPELQGVDLEMYRKPLFEVWKIR